MIIDYAKLATNGVDVAGAVSDTFLNNFSAAHFKHGNPIYQGAYKYTQFSSDVEIDYVVKNAIEFDLSPIPTSRFVPIWRSHLIAKGAPTSVAPKVTPPNLMLRSRKLNFVVKVFKGHTATLDYSVDFTWDLEARCAVVLVPAGDHKALRLEPIKVEFSAPKSQMAQDIRNALAAVAAKRGQTPVPPHRATFGGPNDPVWCAKVEELFIFIMNNVLAMQLTNFIREWDLPRAIDLISGVAISPFYLDVSNDVLTVGGSVQSKALRLSPEDDRAQYFLAETKRRLQSEFDALGDAQVNQWDGAGSATLTWLAQQADAAREPFKSSTSKRAKATDNIALISNSKLFDALARNTLRAHNEQSYEKGIDHIIKGHAGWWYNVGAGSAKVITNGVEVKASMDVGGSAGACIPDLDPKHWGQWKCIDLCVDLSPTPNFDLEAFPTFPADGVYLNLNLKTKAIKLQFCSGVPGWLNDIIGWISSVLTEPLLAVLRLFISLIHFKIVSYPPFFPGTALEFDPRIATKPTNNGDYLCFTADPLFK